MDAEGWFGDPYGRHEARWMSGGVPTALVRDGNVEGSDPPPDGPNGARPSAIPTGGGAPNASAAARDDPGPSRWLHHGYLIASALLLFILGGFYLIHTPALPSHRFVLSPGELAAIASGGPTDPPTCSESIESSTANVGVGVQVAAVDADSQFTVYPHSVIQLYGTDASPPEFSSAAPVCELDDTEAGNLTAATYYAEQPGKVTVYFVDGATHISVVRIVVTASAPPSSKPGWVIVILGVLSCIWGIVALYRRPGGRPSDDLRRADDGGRVPGFDAEKAQRAAWDALDQSSGQY